MSEFVEEIRAYRRQMSILNADYNARREDFEALMARFNSQREAAQNKFIALTGLMKSETTPAEWTVISRFQLKRLHPRTLSYGRDSEGTQDDLGTACSLFSRRRSGRRQRESVDLCIG